MSLKTPFGTRLAACTVMVLAAAFLVTAVVVHHVWTTLVFTVVFALGLALGIRLFGRANRQSRS